VLNDASTNVGWASQRVNPGTSRSRNDGLGALRRRRSATEPRLASPQPEHLGSRHCDPGGLALEDVPGLAYARADHSCNPRASSPVQTKRRASRPRTGANRFAVGGATSFARICLAERSTFPATRSPITTLLPPAHPRPPPSTPAQHTGAGRAHRPPPRSAPRDPPIPAAAATPSGGSPRAGPRPTES
jgi:hypothetical protein